MQNPMQNKIRTAVIFLSLLTLMGSTAASAQPQAFKLAEGRSSVHFDAKSTLHPFAGDTRTLSGEMVWDDTAHQIAEGAVIRIPILPILTGEPKRDEAMRKMFDVHAYPEIEFKAHRVTPITALAGAAAGHDRYRLEGVLRIRQVERPLSLEVTAVMSPQGSLDVSGETLVRTDQFGLKPASVLGLVRVLPEVRIRFQSVWEKV